MSASITTSASIGVSININQTTTALKAHRNTMSRRSSDRTIEYTTMKAEKTPRRLLMTSLCRSVCTAVLRTLLRDPIRVSRPAHRGIVRDQAFAVQIVQAIVHERHSLLLAGLDRILQL